LKKASILACALFLFFAIISRLNGSEEGLFPFSVKWDDASVTFTDISGRQDKPAGKAGFVTVGKDGHFYSGKERIRFFGVNFCFGASFPEKESAEKIAKRMAKFGINSVRFHHMDNQTFPNGIRSRTGKNTRELDPEALDRLDYFLSKLKENGIYYNINLLVSRPFNSNDGLPKEIDKLDWKKNHILGFFYEKETELQREYALKLLTHKNTYTGLSYGEDPATAFVEINNENGLLSSWLTGAIDELPEVFLKELGKKWNYWLKEKYRDTGKLRNAWGTSTEKLSEELLINGDFSDSRSGWTLEQHEGAAAKTVFSQVPTGKFDNSKAIAIKVERPGKAEWHIQFNQPGLIVHPGRLYTLSFLAKSEKPCEIFAELGMGHSPWNNLGFRKKAVLSAEWKKFEYRFTAEKEDLNARINFGALGRQLNEYSFAAVSLKSGGNLGLAPEASLEKSDIPVCEKAENTATIKQKEDWLKFLLETEDAYWQGMSKYLKNELKVKAVVIGTAIGYSTPNLMAELDAADTHAYWQHPEFPGKPWDPENWQVKNNSMVNSRGGVIPALASRRIEGMPFAVTEFNNPAPNTFSGEGFLLLSAYAAFQDWDAIYAFAYSHRKNNWDTGYFTSFFDIDQHPVKMVSLLPAMALFKRGDVSPAKDRVVVKIGKKEELENLLTMSSWIKVSTETAGVPAETSLLKAVSIATEKVKFPDVDFKPVIEPFDLKAFTSDTGELNWDLKDSTHGVVTINSPKSKGVIGFAGGNKYTLGEYEIDAGKTLQDGWCAITITEQEKGTLITATGYIENTGLKWKDMEKNSVGRAWGKAPALCEGINAEISIKTFKSFKVWALNEEGERKTNVPVKVTESGKTSFKISPEYKTLWYEIAN